MKMLITRVITMLVAFVLIGTYSSFAQEPIQQAAPPVKHLPALQMPETQEGIRLGVFADYTQDWHKVDFLQLAGIANCCTNFTKGVGEAGGAFGVLVEYPLFGKLWASLRGSYVVSRSTLTGEERTRVGFRDGTSKPGVFERTLNTSIVTAGVEPMIGFSPVSGLTLYAGARAGFALRSKFDQIETLVSPVEGTFENGQRTRNPQNGSAIPDVQKLAWSLLAGVSYELPLNVSGSLSLAPEAFFMYGLGSPVQNLTWKTVSLRAGASIRYTPVRASQAGEREAKMRQLAAMEERVAVIEQSITKEREKIQNQIQELKKTGVFVRIPQITGVDKEGRITTNPTVRVEEFPSSKTLSVLNRVFFEDGSGVLPSRYTRIRAADRENYRIENLSKVPIENMYQHTLNIIGKRLAQNPQAKLTIIGCNTDVGYEKGNRKLSRQRAQAVADYLQDVWRIPATRLDVQDRNLPEQVASTDSASLGESRCVEFRSDNAEVFKPLVFTDPLRVVGLKVIRLALDVSAGPGLKQWALEATQVDGNEVITLKYDEGAINPPEQFDIDLTKNPSFTPTSENTIDFRLTAADIQNNVAEAPIFSIPVRQLTVEKKQREGQPQKRIDFFDVLAVSYGTTTLSPEAALQASLETLRKAITPKSSVTVKCYAEVGGDAVRNRAQAELRAQTVATLLNLPNAHIVVDFSPFNASQPEGRMYSRAVSVRVETPM